MSRKPTKRNPQVPPDCPPGLSAQLQEYWANFWKGSPLAPELDSHGISELKRLWLLMAERDHLDAAFLDIPRRVLLGTEGPEVEGAFAIIERQKEIFDEVLILWDLFLMNPLARAKREAGDFD